MDGFECLGEASNGLEAISLAKKVAPDLAIIDLKMPLAGGAEVFVELRRWSPETRVIILTGLIATATFQSLVENGIDGLFLKACEPMDLINGIQKVAAGERIIHPDVQSALDQASKSDLTKRELQILHAIARGETNPIIAEKLGISPKTVDSHRTSIMKKMGTHTVAELLTKALKAGFIGEES